MVMLLYLGSSTVNNYIGDLNAEKRHRKKHVGEKGGRMIGGKIKKVKEKEKRKE